MINLVVVIDRIIRNTGDLSLPECHSLRRVELTIRSLSVPPWVVEYLSVINFDVLEELVLSFMQIHRVKQNYKDTYKSLDECLAEKTDVLGDAFPKLAIVVSRSHRRLFAWPMLLDTVRKLLPKTMATELCQVRY